MPQSPFVSFGNAVLTFQLPGAAAGTDPVTGNRMFAAGESLVVAAMLKAGSSYNKERLPGVDPQAVYLEGRVISVSSGSGQTGLLLPNTLQHEARASATWDELNGEFVILRRGRSPFKTEQILGDRLQGWFEIK
ncbi:hypothetical protein VF14_03135 [Nostoc linckia z18]|jgi:hypothetical protein|uniref:Uncharacterized protein n=2 Tax=Nostoc linckia TaxID=92942 RepID=A0A9Q6ENP6_NOSLI|nr:hypothetical protein [Nostoc linckia]PHK42374.1 hypothetical protein VF12_03150 [Nostoc linckia z15]PHK46815.1 hypothetical protein VF13_09020 [Nostoc linckia z16]PHJ69144.1 hypothetical protein VF02_00605 [Nostoc linckia z1]PHJ73295.1 hypothetical protein VF05_01620 [Nostoc linckia z3]PHJ78642.1 hypothetical protein VF03_00605 [Nostoc linckia z2]